MVHRRYNVLTTKVASFFFSSFSLSIEKAHNYHSSLAPLRERECYKFPAYARRCLFLYNYCIGTEHHDITQALTEKWSSILYEPGTLLGTS